MALALVARRAGARALVVPRANAGEAALVSELAVWPAADLAQLMAWLADPGDVPPPAPALMRPGAAQPDLAEVIESLGPQPVDLLGHSMGGKLTVMTSAADARSVSRHWLRRPPGSPPCWSHPRWKSCTKRTSRSTMRRARRQLRAKLPGRLTSGP